MKIILTENKFNDFLTNFIKKTGIKVVYEYLSHGPNNITGTVFLYKDGEILGFRHGYNFYYRFDKRFGSLTYDGHWLGIQLIDIFKFFPPDNLVSHIKEKNSFLFN